MEDSLSSMDWQQDTPPPVYHAPSQPFHTTPAAPKRSFAEYAQDTEAPEGAEVVEGSRRTRATEHTEDTGRPELPYQPPYGHVNADLFHANAHLNNYGARNHTCNNPVYRENTPSTGRFASRHNTDNNDDFLIRGTTPPPDPLPLRCVRNIAAGSIVATKQFMNLTITTVSTLIHGAARARRFAQRHRHRRDAVITFAIHAANAVKRRCMQIRIPQPAPATLARRSTTPPATPPRSPRRSPPRFTSGRINAEENARAKKTAAATIIEKDDWTKFLPAPTTADLQLQKLYEMGDDDFMDETMSVVTNRYMQSSPASAATVTYSPASVSSESSVTYSAAVSSAESVIYLPASVSSAESITYSPAAMLSAEATTYSPVAVGSATKLPSSAASSKRSPGIARHFQKTPKKSVGFFVSPRTGAPVSRVKKYIKGEAMNFPVESTPGSATTISSFSSSFLRQHEPFSTPTILDDSEAETRNNPSFIQHPDPADDSGMTTHIPQNIESFSGLASLEESKATANEYPNLYEHEELAGTAKHAVLRPIHNRGIVTTRPRSPTNLIVTALGSPVKAGPSSPTSFVGQQGRSEEDVATDSKQHDEASDKENQSPSAVPVDQSPTLAERSAHQTSPRAEHFAVQHPTQAGELADQSTAQGGQPSNGPVTPRGLDEDFAGLLVSVRRTSTRQQLKREAEEQRQAEQAAKEAEETALKKKAEEEARKKAEEERKQAEEERKKEKARRIPTGKVILPLSSEWEERIAQTMGLPDSHEVATTSSGTKLFRRDLGTLLPQTGRDRASGWLNDEIVAAYLQAVVDYGLETTSHKRGQTPKYYAFNTFFYKNVRDKGPESVKRWATRAKIGGKNLENVERVLIPVHEAAHWTLLVISPIRKTIEYFDSLSGSPDRYIRNAKAWLAQELGSAWKEDEWEVVDSTSPQQNNSKDCGVFTVTTAKMVVLGVDPTAYGYEDIPLQRKRMVAELMHGGFTEEFEPRF